MKIVIETIPNKQQRYPTCGDYWIDEDGVWQIRVSDLGDWRYEVLIAIHELVEQSLITNKGIKLEDIDKFDIEFEAKRPEGNTDEPGDDPEAPYATEHCIATGIERAACAGLGISWKLYSKTVDNL